MTGVRSKLTPVFYWLDGVAQTTPSSSQGGATRSGAQTLGCML
jgi:hypothetical protein